MLLDETNHNVLPYTNVQPVSKIRGIPIDIFHKVIDLSDNWEIATVLFNSDQDQLVITLHELEGFWKGESCPRCHSRRVTCYDHVGIRSWRHLNGFNKVAILSCSLPRGRCAECQQIYRVRPPWEGKSKHFTKDFEEFLLTMMQEMPVKKVARMVRETDQKLWRMLFAHVESAQTHLSTEAMKILRQQWSKRKRG